MKDPAAKESKAKESRADALLHPIRMRLMQVLAQSGPLTPQQLGEALPDVPQATLYRHLQKLAEAGVVEVVDERPVRGAREKTYALPASGAVLGPEEFASASREDHLRYFTAYMASLLGNFARYVEQEQIDLLADGVGYRTMPLYLSDEEFARMAQALREAVRPYLANKPSPDRRLRQLSTILMPAMDRPPADDKKD